MALKFLNKKGWHTGSLRNIENVWKAEQKQEGEQKKLEELRKQIHEERERAEFRVLQEQAGLVPRQERLDFLYESGLAVGKSSESFKELAAPPSGPAPIPEPSSSKAAAPGALFEDKPQSANDSWRKLHSDPLLLIRQREKDALDRIKNNPMKMALIKKSAEVEKQHKGGTKHEKKEKKSKHKLKHEKHQSRVCSDSEVAADDMKEKGEKRHSISNRHRHRRTKHKRDHSDSDDMSERDEEREKRDPSKHSSRSHSDTKGSSRRKEELNMTGLSKYDEHDDKERRKGVHTKDGHHEEQSRKGERSRYDDRQEVKRKGDYSKYDDRQEEERRTGSQSRHEPHEEEKMKDHYVSKTNGHTYDAGMGYRQNRNQSAPKLSKEERAARLREMQLDAELHEEQRWKRVKTAAEADAREATQASSSGGKNFLDAAQKSFFGAEKGGSATIEESLRRRTFYSQGGSAHESNAFRR